MIEEIVPETFEHVSNKSVEIWGIIWTGSSDEEPMDEEMMTSDKSHNSQILLLEPLKNFQNASV